MTTILQKNAMKTLPNGNGGINHDLEHQVQNIEVNNYNKVCGDIEVKEDLEMMTDSIQSEGSEMVLDEKSRIKTRNMVQSIVILM
ncbi:hypothetical protein WA026_008801 [Henosepilachna vigintioctopunctata]|uniref:Uncharacterized protein n=1 Tax=Henosepilachna vigintioctopunctata TaxID=420089 RepID=A0AAW1VA25_9CUCU